MSLWWSVLLPVYIVLVITLSNSSPFRPCTWSKPTLLVWLEQPINGSSLSHGSREMNRKDLKSVSYTSRSSLLAQSMVIGVLCCSHRSARPHGSTTLCELRCWLCTTQSDHAKLRSRYLIFSSPTCTDSCLSLSLSFSHPRISITTRNCLLQSLTLQYSRYSP